MRTWITIDQEHINLAAATSIVEFDRSGGWVGYQINHGTRFTKIAVAAELETKGLKHGTDTDRDRYRVILIIRNYLYDRTLRDESGGSRRDDDY